MGTVRLLVTQPCQYVSKLDGGLRAASGLQVILYVLKSMHLTMGTRPDTQSNAGHF